MTRLFRGTRRRPPTEYTGRRVRPGRAAHRSDRGRSGRQPVLAAGRCPGVVTSSRAWRSS